MSLDAIYFHGYVTKFTMPHEEFIGVGNFVKSAFGLLMFESSQVLKEIFIKLSFKDDIVVVDNRRVGKICDYT
jgi:hypothetical protein